MHVFCPLVIMVIYISDFIAADILFKVINDQKSHIIAEEERNAAKRKKWHVIIPLAILAKLIHLKTMVMKVLFGIGTIQVLLVGGGIILYYYLRHNTICKIEPHLIHSHSHVADASLPGKVLFAHRLQSLDHMFLINILYENCFCLHRLINASVYVL